MCLLHEPGKNTIRGLVWNSLVPGDLPSSPQQNIQQDCNYKHLHTLYTSAPCSFSQVIAGRVTLRLAWAQVRTQIQYWRTMWIEVLRWRFKRRTTASEMTTRVRCNVLLHILQGVVGHRRGSHYRGWEVGGWVDAVVAILLWLRKQMVEMTDGHLRVLLWGGRHWHNCKLDTKDVLLPLVCLVPVQKERQFISG